MTTEQMMQAMMEKIAMLEKQLAEKESAKGIVIKLTEKGGLAFYGTGRYPVTLYRNQWIKVLEKRDEILKILDENKDKIDSLEATYRASKAIASKK